MGKLFRNRIKMQNKKYDVIGIGSPLMDFIVKVDDNMLAEMNLKKGEMHLIDPEKSREILKRLENHEVTTAPGGSAANTLAGVSVLGGNAAFLGKIGDDKHGDMYEQMTKDSGVHSRLGKKNKEKTGHTLAFITPDGERTFATHLGASLHFRKDDIFEDEIKASKIIHFEGYQLEDPELKKTSLHAMEIAKNSNVMISIDLSDSALIKRNLKDLRELVQKYADIIFVNENEAGAFTGKKEEDALHEIYDMCKIAVVKLGGRGSIIKSEDMIYRIPAYKTKVINTNGAGDIFAAGILYGIANKWDMEKSGKTGSYAASLVVGQEEARLNQGVDLGKIQ
ncbi:adenosine kinase [Candidatus Woesearchaeota archaeon]|nr:adenosine kinase [Candidatus Woesearchaeota archaeon]